MATGGARAIFTDAHAKLHIFLPERLVPHTVAEWRSGRAWRPSRASKLRPGRSGRSIPVFEFST